jgi:hypothetical protein
MGAVVGRVGVVHGAGDGDPVVGGTGVTDGVGVPVGIGEPDGAGAGFAATSAAETVRTALA